MRRTELKRKKPLKVRHRERIARIGSEAWHKHAARKPCVKCGARPNVGCQGHHIIYQQTLREWARVAAREQERVWEELFEQARWDLRNCLPLCERCHAQHHSMFRQLPLDLVRKHAPRIDQYVRELGLEWVLTKYYATGDRP